MVAESVIKVCGSALSYKFINSGGSEIKKLVRSQHFDSFLFPGVLQSFKIKKTAGLIVLNGGNEGDCLHAPWSLPWCP